MIVDDELIIREGLKNSVDWASLGYQVVAVAKDGSDALKKFNDHQPDVILMDIKMQGKTGLDILKEVKQANPEVEVILLSGYDDFNYAKEGLKNGAFDYILKINMMDELENVEYENLLNIKNNYLFLEFLKGELLNTISINEKHKYGVSVVWLGNHIDDAVELINTTPSILPFVMGQKGQYAIGIYWSEHKNSFEQMYKENMNNLYSMLVKNELYKPVIGIGDFKESIRDIPLSFRQAMKVIDRMRTNDNGGVVQYCELSVNNIMQKQYISRMFKDDILLHGYKCIMEQIQTVFDNGISQKDILISDMHMICTKILLQIEESARLRGASIDDEIAGYITSIKQYDSIIDMKSWFVDIFDELYLKIEEAKKQDRYGSIVKAMNYIDENYNTNLKLEEVAATFYINASYFSTKFKELTGQTFSQYVIQKRVKRACELLKNTTLKIYDISNRVGYRDEKHFSRLFSKYMKMSPRQYRKK